MRALSGPTECPPVVTDSGLSQNDPCKGSLCLPWYVSAWKNAAEREFEIATKLLHIMNDAERQALGRAQEDMRKVPAWWSGFNYRPAIEEWAKIAQALRCLWFNAAQRERGAPPAVTKPIPETAPETTKKKAQEGWWKKWLPDLGSWAPSLSWPALPGFDVALASVWEKLKSWFQAMLPWVIGGVALWLFWPRIVRSIRQ